MSLEELLKEAESGSPWRAQRQKLIRVLLGLATMFFALIIGAALIFSGRGGAPEKVRGAVPEDRESVQALAQLMRLREETKILKEEVSQLQWLAQRDTSAQRQEPAPVQTPRGGAPRAASATQPVVSFDPGEGFVTLVREPTERYIPTGSVFQARLITPIKTSVERTFVMAETTNEFRMDMERRIPKGSRLIGRSRLNPVLKGVIVEFDTLVLPDGIETQISGLALSRNALPEIDGLFFSDRLQTYGTALAFGFLSGFADAGRRREVTPMGARLEESLSNQVLAGLSTASFQVAEDLLRDIRNSAVEYVVVPAGEPVFVALTRRYELQQRRGTQP